MVVWGGSNGDTYLDDGAMYDPDRRIWMPMSGPGSPGARDSATAVWTGSKMIVWGGRDSKGPLGDGALFDPAAGPEGTWSSLPSTGAPSPRWQHTSVWAGKAATGGERMIVWGGYDGSSALKSGGIWAKGSWFNLRAENPPTERRLHTAVWDDANGRMIVFGGLGLDPNSWQIKSLNTGAIHGLSQDNETWIDIAQIGAPPSPRYEHTAIWASTHMIVWGGIEEAGALLNDGARFDVHGNTEWTQMVGMPPVARQGHTTVFFKDINRMVVWGGEGPAGIPLRDGGVFDISRGTWLDTGAPLGPEAITRHTAVAAGSRMIVWGGITATGKATNQGAVLDMTKVP